MIEVFKHEDSGYGDILSREFLNWRTKGVTSEEEDVETARARLLDSISDMPS